MLPAIGFGLAATAPDIIKSISKEKGPYLTYALYDENKQLIKSSQVKIKNREQKISFEAEESGYVEVRLTDPKKGKQDNILVTVNSETNTYIGSENAIGFYYSDPPTLSDAGLSVVAFLSWIKQFGIDVFGDGMTTYTFGSDGSITVSEPGGDSYGMTIDGVLNYLQSQFNDQFETDIANYAGNGGTCYSVSLNGSTYDVSNSAVVASVPRQSGNTCVTTNMSWMMSMFGMESYSPWSFASYWSSYFSGSASGLFQTGWEGTPAQWQSFISAFFTSSAITSFSVSAFQNAIENGSFIMMAITIPGQNAAHSIIVDGYDIYGGSTNPTFSFHDPATGAQGYLSYSQLIGAITYNSGTPFVSLVDGINPNFHG